MPSDPSRLIAALARDRINLDLKTLDLCFLAGLGAAVVAIFKLILAPIAAAPNDPA